MVEPVKTLDADTVRERLAAVREQAGDNVEILVATKYVPLELMPELAKAGVKLVGENRLQDLEAKHDLYADDFRWDFIGTVQSRKVPRIAARVGRIHSIDSHSAMAKLAAAAENGHRPEILIQVNVAGEEGKSGVDPDELPGLIEACPLPVQGLTTMPPLADKPEDSRRWFAKLAELADRHGLTQLSMGTSQDWPVAVEEGATIIRLGSSLLR